MAPSGIEEQGLVPRAFEQEVAYLRQACLVEVDAKMAQDSEQLKYWFTTHMTQFGKLILGQSGQVT